MAQLEQRIANAGKYLRQKASSTRDTALDLLYRGAEKADSVIDSVVNVGRYILGSQQTRNAMTLGAALSAIVPNLESRASDYTSDGALPPASIELTTDGYLHIGVPAGAKYMQSSTDLENWSEPIDISKQLSSISTRSVDPNSPITYIREEATEERMFFRFIGDFDNGNEPVAVPFIDDFIARAEITEYTPQPNEDQGIGWKSGIGGSYTPVEGHEFALKLIPDGDESRVQYVDLDGPIIEGKRNFFIEYDRLAQDGQMPANINSYIVAKGSNSTDDRSTWEVAGYDQAVNVPYEFLQFTPSRINTDDRFVTFGDTGANIPDLREASQIQALLSPELAKEGFTTYDILFNNLGDVNPNGSLDGVRKGPNGFFFHDLAGNSNIGLGYDNPAQVSNGVSILINHGVHTNSQAGKYTLNGQLVPEDNIARRGNLTLLNLSESMVSGPRTSLGVRADYSAGRPGSIEAGYGIARIAFCADQVHLNGTNTSRQVNTR